MTVTYLKDGRIEVKDAHDALLLQLAGIKLVDASGQEWIFLEQSWGVLEYCNNLNHWLCNKKAPQETLYVPADVARLLVTNTSDGGIGWDYLYASMIAEGDILRFESWDDEEYIYMRRYNDRWNLLPDIEMER